jgi:hypothetical protein
MIDPLEEPTASVESACGGVQMVVSWPWSRMTVPGSLEALGAGVAAASAVVAMLLAADVAAACAGGLAGDEQPAVSSAASRKDAHPAIRVPDDGVVLAVNKAGALGSVGLGSMRAA